MDNNDGVLVGGDSDVVQETTAEVQQPAESNNSNSLGGYSFTSMIAIYLVIIAAMYIFMIRPQKKKQQKIADMQSELQSGDEVVTTSGFHGKIVGVEEKTFTIEFGINKGVLIPVSKSEVYKVKSEEDKK